MIAPIQSRILARMRLASYPSDCPLPLSELRYLQVPYRGFDGLAHTGELVVNVAIANGVEQIFTDLFRLSYPIEKMRLVDDYGGDDESSMSDDNTSCFNYRLIDGSTRLSLHAYGLALDVNPLYNPYVRTGFGNRDVLPINAAPYVDREGDCPYYIRRGDVCHDLFCRHGFAWGGDWKHSKDYQHFEKGRET